MGFSPSVHFLRPPLMTFYANAMPSKGGESAHRRRSSRRKRKPKYNNRQSRPLGRFLFSRRTRAGIVYTEVKAMNIVSVLLVLFLAVIGLAEVCRFLSLRLFARRDDCTVMYITCVDADCGDVEFVLRSALSKRRWTRLSDVSTIVLDAPLDSEARGICERVCREYGFSRLMTKKEFLKSLD